MKKLFLLFLPILILSGCISKTATILEFENLPLTEENSRVVSNQAKTFTVRVFEDHQLALLGEQNGAELYLVGDEAPGGEGMHIEKYPISADAAIKDVFTQEGVQELMREELVINDLPVTKLILQTPALPNLGIPLYFVDGGDETYLLRLIDANEYPYFEAVVNSFALAN